jgi:polyphosphate:AMP phosphotransferase
MLEKVDLKREMTKEDSKAVLEQLKNDLAALDAPIIEAKLPVMIIFEGWSGAGKGSAIRKLIGNFDPRWFSVHNVQPPTEVDLREPMMWRYWQMIPENGKIAIYDRSWYEEIGNMRLENDVDEMTNLRHMNEINSFERGLYNNGYCIVKIFLHISEKEMKKRLEKLDEDKSTKWRVNKKDKERLKKYDTYYECYDSVLEYTNTPEVPWHVVSGMDKRACTVDVFTIVRDAVRKAIQWKKEKDAASKVESAIITPGQYRFMSMPLLGDVDLNKSLGRDEYKLKLKDEQKRLADNHNRLYLHKIPLIIAYEGWDAAGKGGNIKRVSQALDPRGYEVMPIASPTPDEKNRHFLWRFWKRLPKDGHVTIFDRTWYGRVMVERIEGFCSAADWQRAYGEINDFERQLYDWGAIVIKFWIHISNEEQLARFNERKETPEKQWKLTDEDWRNREKWPLYEEAVNDMIRYTSTDFAPWHIIAGNDKYYARIQTLEIINEAIENRLKKVRD